MRKIALGILILFCCVAVKCSFGQTLKFTQIEKASGNGSVVITTGTNNVLTYTNSLPSALIPTLSAYVPYTGATNSVNLGAQNFSTSGTVSVNLIVTNTISSSGNSSVIIQTNGTNSVVFDNAGNMGLGTSTPTYGIDVSLSKPSGISAIRATNTSSTGFSYLAARGFTTSGGIFVVGPNASAGGAYSNNNVMFSCNTSGQNGIVNEGTGPFGIYVNGYSTAQEAIRIDNNRNVLIAGSGPTHPVNSGTASALLHIGAASSSLPPLRFTGSALVTGTNIIAGGIEYLTDAFYGTISTGTARSNFLQNGIGFSTGQSVVGGTAASNGLTLTSTSHATKGKVFFGTASVYDQANDRLGIGSISPTSKLSINTGAATFNFSDYTFTYGSSLQITTTGGGYININPSANVGLAAYGSSRLSYELDNSIGNTNIQNKYTSVGQSNVLAGSNTPTNRFLGATKTFQTGALPTLYFNYFTAHTLAFSGASTGSDIYGNYFEVPIAGTNATITRKWSIGTNGGVNITSGIISLTQGADVASAAGAITLGADGNTFEITGTSAITLINSTNWKNGCEVTLLFTSTASLTDGVANSGSDIGMELNGNANFTGSADDSITLTLCEIGGVQRWREKSRSVN